MAKTGPAFVTVRSGGTTFTYRILIGNNGPEATNFVVSDQLTPPDSNVTAVITDMTLQNGGCTIISDTVRGCQSFGPLAAGSFVEATVTVRATCASSTLTPVLVRNDAGVGVAGSQDPRDPISENNNGTHVLSVTCVGVESTPTPTP